MYLISMKQEINVGQPERGFIFNAQPKTDYLVNDDFFVTLKQMYESNIEKSFYFPADRAYNGTAKSVLFQRSGGIGDILFTLPYLKALHESGVKVGFCCFNHNAPVLDLIHDYIDEIVPEPLPFSKISEYEQFVSIMKYIEANPKAEKVDAITLAEDIFNIPRPPLYSQFQWRKPKSRDIIHIMIQFSSSSNIRDVSPKLWWDLGTKLPSDHFKLTFVGPKDLEKQIAETISYIKMFSPEIPIKAHIGDNLTEVFQFILKVNPPHIFVGPDSGLTNFAGYHGIPTIGLYGPFPSKLRMLHYENAIGIDVKTNCPFRVNSEGDCFGHGGGKCALAVRKETDYSPCMLKHELNPIVKAIEYWLENYYGIKENW